MHDLILNPSPLSSPRLPSHPSLRLGEFVCCVLYIPADHSSISSRHKMGPPAGTRSAIALLTLYLLVCNLHMPWNWNRAIGRKNSEECVNPFTPKSDQFQISPAASPAILHDTAWRTWLFIAYSDGKCFCYQILTTSLIHFSRKGWENVLLEIGSEKVNFQLY